MRPVLRARGREARLRAQAPLRHVPFFVASTAVGRRRLTALAVLTGLVTGTSCTAVAGWLAPSERLDFPAEPLCVTANERHYDVDQNGVADFALLGCAQGRVDALAWDEDEDGMFERTVRLDAREGPRRHLVLLVDSLPYREVAQRHAAGAWPWFHPPQLVLPPFPSLSEVTFAALLGAPRQPGMIERYYDRAQNRVHDGYRARARGYEHPWQRLLDVHLGSYLRVGLSYLAPRSWIDAEFQAAKAAFDTDADDLTLAYVVTTSAMLSRHGQAGLDESLARLEPLCVQLLHDTEGAIDITIVSDHGHNLVPSENFRMEPVLAAAGFRVSDRIRDVERDVVLDIDGLVTFFAVHTSRPREVADVLLTRDEVELTMAREGEAVLVRDRDGAALIEERDGRLRYTPRTKDVLALEPALAALAAAGALDADGFASDRAWFEATWRHAWPDALRRIHDAFHGLVDNTPDVLVTLRAGHCAGDPAMDRWIDMRSTHGGLDFATSAAVVLTTVAPLPEPVRSAGVLPALGVLPIEATRTKDRGPAWSSLDR